jgi:6-phosphofructokinase 1
MSVENDINGSHYSLGFSTALASGYHHLHSLRAMAGSREEIAVVELFGRTYGLTTMLIAVLAGADRVLIPEVPFDPERLAHLLIEDKRIAPANYAILAMSEAVAIAPEAAAQYGAALRRRGADRPSTEVEPVVLAGEREIGLGAGGSGAVVTEILERLVGQRMVFQPLNYLLRVGPPDGQDLLGAVNFARMAVELLAARRMGRLVVYQRGVNYTDIPLQAMSEPDGRMDMVEVYDRALCRAKPGLLWAVRF